MAYYRAVCNTCRWRSRRTVFPPGTNVSDSRVIKAYKLARSRARQHEAKTGHQAIVAFGEDN